MKPEKYYNDLRLKLKGREWFTLTRKGYRISRKLRWGISLPKNQQLVSKVKGVGETFKMMSHSKNKSMIDYYLEVFKVKGAEENILKQIRHTELGEKNTWLTVSQMMAFYEYKNQKYLLHLVENPLRWYGSFFQSSSLKSFIKKHGITETLIYHFKKVMKEFYRVPRLHGALNNGNIYVIHDKDYVFQIKITSLSKMQKNNTNKIKPVGGNTIPLRNRLKASRKLLINKRLGKNIKLVNNKPPKKYISLSSGVKFTNNSEVLKMLYPSLYKLL